MANMKTNRSTGQAFPVKQSADGKLELYNIHSHQKELFDREDVTLTPTGKPNVFLASTVDDEDRKVSTYLSTV